jgi:hypothetical protein
MSTMPRLSILMPSRNRASLLKDSIRTAIDQDFDDYEVIVSDNNSHDDTRRVVEDAMAGSRKVKYVHTGRDLSMCDSFEFALTKAQGEYVIFLCDDDALVPGALPYISQILSHPASSPIDILVWQRGGYGHSDLPDNMTRHFLAYRLRSGNLYEIESRLLLDALCKFEPSIYFAIPKTINCAISRRAFQVCMKRTGRFFMPPYPDYTAVCQLLSTHPTYHLIDSPLYLCGTSTQANSGMFSKRLQKLDEYCSLFGPNEITLKGVPYAMPYLTASYLLGTYLRFQEIYPETFDSPIDLTAYLRIALAELIYYEQFEDISGELKQISDYMQQHTGSCEMFDRLARDLRRASRKNNLAIHARMLVAGHPVVQRIAVEIMRILRRGRADARQYANVKL